jgi:SAM-dependent methyltransferase
VSAADHAYWDAVGAEWRRRRPHGLWREYSDRHQIALVDRWLGPRCADTPPREGRGRLLKTDLFDEVAGRGLAGELATRGWAVTGIDVSPLVVAEAEVRNPGLEAAAADVRSLPFPDAHFDAVFSGSTLDHFETSDDIRLALVEIARVLRPGGSLLLTLDNPSHPLVWLRNGPLLGLVRRLGIVPYHVGATLSRRPLADAVQAAGFEIGHMTAVLHCPRVLAVALAGPVSGLGRTSREAFLRMLASCETLERIPTRWRTGHYLAVSAVRKAAQGPEPVRQETAASTPASSV